MRRTRKAVNGHDENQNDSDDDQDKNRAAISGAAHKARQGTEMRKRNCSNVPRQ